MFTNKAVADFGVAFFSNNKNATFIPADNGRYFFWKLCRGGGQTVQESRLAAVVLFLNAMWFHCCQAKRKLISKYAADKLHLHLICLHQTTPRIAPSHMNQLKFLVLFAALLIVTTSETRAQFVFKKNAGFTVSISSSEAAVVQTAYSIFENDHAAVFNGKLVQGANGQLVAGTLGVFQSPELYFDHSTLHFLNTHAEAFAITVKKNKLYVLGSDKRGTAYGILELSRRMGVSPWEWWADSKITKKDQLILPDGFKLSESPSVRYRGIFINDEDWGLNPWSYLTHEPSDVKGQIGPKTHARIFELLLRLRANTFWPAMHDVSVAFYVTPGNKEMADKYGIVLGASHCEPMMRNTNAEWKTAGTGQYDYVHNRENVLKFWEERVTQLKQAENIYTVGIRGVHDGKMLGANTLQEQKDALIGVLRDQRQMIGKHLNNDVTKVPQVFIPYKEVLDVYNMGLEVPEDVTLMWPDDNYGYIRHFPNEKEKVRRGGNGVYYHVSYWGRPHDYLWLATTHPALVYTQMKMAYSKGAKDMWILNVGDIKPAEYLTELFMDMAWNIDAIENNQQGLEKHLQAWLGREFGNAQAKALLPVMTEYYRLAYIRKPEYMGNTRTEETDPKYKIVADLPWSEPEINTRLQAYGSLAERVQAIGKTIAPDKADAWFELVEYPVRGAAEMNKKHLYGQLARHGKADWARSGAAFDTIEALTARYNALAGGKWKNMMSSEPRKLAVFQKLPQTTRETPAAAFAAPVLVMNGSEYVKFTGSKPVLHGLGYAGKAVSVAQHSTVEYQFRKTSTRDSAWIGVAVAPNHPVSGKAIRYQLFVNGEPVQILEFHTAERSEEWKQNVLRNQSVRIIPVALQPAKKGSITIGIKALDEGVILDQVKLWLEKPGTEN